MNRCDCDKTLLMEYAIGEIDPPDIPGVEAQIRNCPVCAEDLRLQRNMVTDLESRPEAIFPQHLREVLVRSAVHARRDLISAAPQASSGRVRFSWTPVLCASAGLAIVAVMMLLLMPGATGGSMDEMVFGGAGRGATALNEILDLFSNLRRGWDLLWRLLEPFTPVVRAVQSVLVAFGVVRWTMVLLSVFAATALVWRFTRTGQERSLKHAKTRT